MQRILIVDDDVHVCETLRRVLEHAGLVNEISVSAELAMRAAAEFRPDAAIIDFVLPDTDGIILTEQLKREFPGIHVVMISGIADFEESVGDLARSAGVNVFVQKPFRASEILAALSDPPELS